MIRVSVTGDKELLDRFKGTAPRVIQSLERAVLRIVIKLQRYVVLTKLEGSPLHHRTGNLERATVYSQPEITGDTISATVGVTGLAPYGKVHEYGGTVSVREQMRTSKLGKEFSVRSHMATYPERSFLRSSLRENETSILAEINKAVQDAL